MKNLGGKLYFYHADLIQMVEYCREMSKWHLPQRNEEDAKGQKMRINPHLSIVIEATRIKKGNRIGQGKEN